MEITTGAGTAAPEVDSFTPTSGVAGDTVVITGKGFTGAEVVFFNDVLCTSFTVDSDTQITAIVPSSVTSGDITVGWESSTAFTLTASAYSDLQLADTPTHMWKLWDASGATAIDSSGNGRNATYVGSPTLAAATILDPDTSAKSVTFNGTSQYLTRANESSLHTTDFCFEAVVKINGGSGTFRAIASTRDESNENGWLLYANSSNQWDLRTGSGSSIMVVGTPTVGSVYHIVLGYDGTKFHLYVNGAELGTAGGTTFAYTPSTTGLYVATRTDTSFDAPISVQGVAHYAAMLSGTRVSAHYAAL